MNDGPISFPDWKDALTQGEPDPVRRRQIEREIIGFLRHCRQRHAAATVAVIRQYLAGLTEPDGGSAREALRWFYRHGQKRGKVTPGLAHQSGRLAMPPKSTEPPPAALDRGDTPWESALIRVMRERGLLWRTEQTYRAWAVRFARFIAPRSPYAADAADVRNFLSALAVEGRASPSAQKQALNAIVFLMQEALSRQLGELDFERARPRRRVPTVLSVGECRALFAQLEGTQRLMAELAYGAGLRLMELLRLRVHHLDLLRGRLQVRGGKGDKDRVTVLPEALIPGLRAHVERLRPQWAADRAGGLAGVWLPEGLARKYPHAGERFEWQWLFPSRQPSVDPATKLVRRHHLSDMTFQRLVRAAAERAGLTKRVTPHVFRHSFATHLLESGSDICARRHP